ncbi:hypothetical protein [Myroides injenensis]|uniref:hypothetical protein n=1 Tax=Myroides injenensis TaxID=1183151 RepID=UPI00226D8A4D|nr:hypothetical protein [Myroides injenensis]
MKLEKIATFIVLLWLVYGIFTLDSSNLWSIQVNWFSFLGFLVFVIYLIYSLKKAARQQDTFNK